MNGKTNSFPYYEKLKKHNCKLTKPRQTIIDILNRNQKHIRAEKVFNDCSKVYPALGLATVYRNLELLVHIGVVCKFDSGDKIARYSISQRAEGIHHHHLVCRKCHSVIDYSESLNEERGFLMRREKKLSRVYGFKIESHCVDFLGLCKECSDKK